MPATGEATEAPVVTSGGRGRVTREGVDGLRNQARPLDVVGVCQGDGNPRP